MSGPQAESFSSASRRPVALAPLGRAGEERLSLRVSLLVWIVASLAGWAAIIGIILSFL